MSEPYRSLRFTDTWLADFASKDFTASDRAAFRKALRLFDTDERHPSLRVRQLKGDRAGSWSVSASDSMRMTFARLDGGLKAILTCSKHYWLTGGMSGKCQATWVHGHTSWPAAAE